MKTGGAPSSGFTRLSPKTAGFTIVETLIVLAVTSALFVLAAVAINGKQAKTEFMTAIQSAQQQMQEIINQTASGHFPDKSNFGCIGNLGAFAPTLSNTATAQGTNIGCVFVGKAVQIAPSGAPSGYNVITLAGNQRNAFGYESSSLAEAKPVAVAPGSFYNNTLTGITEPGKFSGGLTVAWMHFISAGGAIINTSVVGFLSSLGSYNSLNQLNSGSQQLSLYAVKNTSLNMGAATAVDAIDTAANLDNVDNPAQEVDICFVSGTTDQSGLMTIGGGGSQLAVTMTIKGNTTCA